MFYVDIISRATSPRAVFSSFVLGYILFFPICEQMFIPAVWVGNIIHYSISTHGHQSGRLCCASLITYSAAEARLYQAALMINGILQSQSLDFWRQRYTLLSPGSLLSASNELDEDWDTDKVKDSLRHIHSFFLSPYNTNSLRTYYQHTLSILQLPKMLLPK